jgi:hypothetical protein
MPGVVCSAMSVHTVSISCWLIACFFRKSRGVRSIHLEAFAGAAVLVSQAHVVEHAAAVQQLRVKLQSTMLACQGAEVVHAAGMMKITRGKRCPEPDRLSRGQVDCREW